MESWIEQRIAESIADEKTSKHYYDRVLRSARSIDLDALHWPNEFLTQATEIGICIRVADEKAKKEQVAIAQSYRDWCKERGQWP